MRDQFRSGHDFFYLIPLQNRNPAIQALDATGKQGQSARSPTLMKGAQFTDNPVCSRYELHAPTCTVLQS